MSRAPERTAAAALVIDRLAPAFDSALKVSGGESAEWMNGALFGAVSTYLHLGAPAGATVTPEAAFIIYGDVCAVLEEMAASDGDDLSATARRMVPDAFVGSERHPLR